MEYIINPMWFYWAEVCNTLKIITIIVCCIFLVATLIMTIGSLVDESKEEFEVAKKLVVGAIITVLMATFIPSRETLIKMQIAKFGTKDNVEVVLQTIDDKTDKLIEAIGKDK